MSDPGFQPGFHRDMNSIIQAFNAGLQFDPPAISVSEFRAALAKAGVPMDSRYGEYLREGLPVEDFDPDDQTPPEPPEEDQ